MDCDTHVNNQQKQKETVGCKIASISLIKKKTRSKQGNGHVHISELFS